MRAERENHWSDKINYVLANFFRAEAWDVRLNDHAGEELASFGQRGDVTSVTPGFRQGMRKLAATAERQEKYFAWRKLNVPIPDPMSAKPRSRSVFQFVCRIGAGELLTGGVLVDRATFETSDFKSETELLAFLTGAATGIARERRVSKENWALKNVLSALAVHCIIVDRAGRVVFETPHSGDAPGGIGTWGEAAIPPLQGVIQQVQKQLQELPAWKSTGYQVTSVDLGAGNRTAVYVLPLPNEGSPSGDFDLLALILPQPFEPPCDEALAATLSLTPAEARVVRQIMFGKRVRRIADEMSLTEQTVRTYLKRTYAKLGVTSQSELIAKVSGLYVPLNSSE